MATTQFSVTTTPAIITGLTPGTNYAAQNIGGTIIRYGSYTSVPSTDGSSPAFTVYGDGDFILQPVSGENIYVWVASPGSHGTIVYDEIQDSN